MTNARMCPDIHSTTNRDNSRQWHRSRSRLNIRPSSSTSQSSTDTSQPTTPLDSAFTHLHPHSCDRPAVPRRTGTVEDYWSRKCLPEPDIHSTPTSSRSSLEETPPHDYQTFIERSRSHLRTQTVTPATVYLTRQHASDRMRIPFQGQNPRDSGSSTDSGPLASSSDSASTYEEELGGIPARHPLRNRVNSKGSSLLLNEGEARSVSPKKSFYARAHTYRPKSTSSHLSSSSPPRISVTLRLKPKKNHSHRGAMTLFKSLASSPISDSPRKLEDVEFDWAEQRRQDLVRRARLLELDETRRDTEAHTQAEEAGPQVPEQGDNVMAQDTLPIRPKSWELTPEELALRHDQEEEEAKKFIYKDHVWMNRSYVSAHPKDTVPYPFAYDTVNIQTERHSHDLIKQLFGGRPSIHGDLSQKPPAFVLDLGCGDGTWLCDAAQCWKNTRCYGLDLQALHPSRAQLQAELGETADNITFTCYNFLLDKLPYLDEKFDLVRMANLKWAIPEDKWDFVLQEVHRVLKRGGWVEVIDDDFLLGSSPQNTLSAEQNIISDMLETQFMDMLQARGLLLNTGSIFMGEKLGNRFNAFHEDDFPIAISKARPLSVELQGQSPVQVILPSEGMSQKAAKLMGFGSDSSHEKHHSTSSTTSRSRSGSTSSGISQSSNASRSSGREAEHTDEGIDNGQPESVDEPQEPQSPQPLGLEVIPGRFIPFPPTELHAHAIRNMQSILASKEAIRAYTLKKNPELEALEVSADLLPVERQRYAELSLEWNKQQSAFDDTFWDFEIAMLKRLNLSQRCFDADDDDEHPKVSNVSSRPQPVRIASGLSKSNKSSDGNLPPSPAASTFAAGSRTMVRHIRVYSGWK